MVEETITDEGTSHQHKRNNYKFSTLLGININLDPSGFRDRLKKRGQWLKIGLSFVETV